jgi:flagellar protein FlaG
MRIENGFSNNYNMSGTTKEAPAAPTKEQLSNTAGNEKSIAVESDEVINDAMLENSVEAANANLVQYNRMIERTIHEKTHTIMYVLKDTVTNEVIREFPPRKIQDMIAKMWELAGLFVDERR